MKPVRQHAFAAIACADLLAVCVTAWSAPRDPQGEPLDTSAESSAYQATHNESRVRLGRAIGTLMFPESMAELSDR
jgi:hypothetical protein